MRQPHSFILDAGFLCLETALNLVWLSVSAALMLFGSIQVMRAGKDRSRGMTAVAMVCLICLLFPVISMTDDLYSGSLTLPEPNKIKRFLSVMPLAALVLPWMTLQRPSESAEPVSRRGEDPNHIPVQDLLCFQLSRRPPPSNS